MAELKTGRRGAPPYLRRLVQGGLIFLGAHTILFGLALALVAGG